MKLFYKVSLVFLLVAAFCSPLQGCGFGVRDNSPGNKSPRIKIGVALYKQDDTFISTLSSDFQAAAKVMEADKQITITIDTVDSKGSQALQNEQVDRFLAQNYDVICVNMVDRTVAAVIIDKAKIANIPVIFFNREPVEEDLHRWNRLYYVGAIAKHSGMLQGEYVASCYRHDPSGVDRNSDGKLQYVMLEGEPGHQDALIRTEHSIKTVTHAGIKVEKLANDTANWQRGQASSKMAQWIETFGDQIEVVFCNNDDMALGAIDALTAADVKRFPVIVGIDGTAPALKAVKDGTLTGTVLNDSKGQAQVMLDLAYALAFDLNVQDAAPLLDGKYVRLPYWTITPENVDTVER